MTNKLGTTARRFNLAGRLLPAALVASLLGLPASAHTGATTVASGNVWAAGETPKDYIVRADPGRLAEITQKLQSRGASITRSLPMINSVAVRAAQSAEGAILVLDGVDVVATDALLQPMSVTSDRKKNDKRAEDDRKDADKRAEDDRKAADKAAELAAEQDKRDADKNEAEADRRADDEDDRLTAADPDSSRDGGSLESVARATGASKLWRRGLTGQGVDVALIDTGIAPVQGAPVSLPGADLSLDAANANLRFLDGYGHGTHMAGIIAGRDNSVTNPRKPRGGFVGIAPRARVINVKVGAMDGSVHTSQVIAALDWVVQNRSANGMNIRVVNLSYGAPATPDWQKDPLAWASEIAWRRGIVVVAAAGNDGPGHELASPAYSPQILAVGATEIETNRGGRAEYTVAPYTSTGTRRRPDVFVPGGHVMSLRVKGSFIDTFLAAGIVNDRLTRGTGTSQATAVASGLAALLIEAFPAATPDQIKMLMISSADPAAGKKDALTGIESNVDVNRAWQMGRKKLPVVTVTDPFAACGSTWCRGAGDGSLQPWAQAAWSGSAWSGSAWSGSAWSGSAWSGSAWSGRVWSGSAWSGSAWSGSAWSGSAWSGSAWSGSAWSGSAWSGSAWSGSAWSGSAWSGSAWSGSAWSGSAWSSAWNA